jgi:exosortase C (VPDSG-CTERM-specific)
MALKRFAVAAAVIALCFCVPLYQLIRFSLGSLLYSYILLVPFVVLYLARAQKKKIQTSGLAGGFAMGFSIAAIAALALYWSVLRGNSGATESDRLCVLMVSFVFSVYAASAVFLGRAFLRTALFPMSFLLFVIPLPFAVESAFSSFLQHGSAEAAYWLLRVTGTPLMRQDTLFILPNISMEVAPECSGIRSSIVLILTALVAAHFFLRSFWTKAVLVGAALFLGIVRNAIRIFTLAQLCIHVSPTIIDSPLHHRGGPIFFLISLLPFLALIWFLRRIESRRVQAEETTAKQNA